MSSSTLALLPSGSFLLILATTTALSAGPTNFINAFRAAASPAPSVWGTPTLGSPVTITPDPRALQLAAPLHHTVQRFIAGPPTSSTSPSPASENDQQQAIRQLQLLAGASLEVHLRPGNLTVMQIRGGILQPALARSASLGLSAAAPVSGAERTARAFLQSYRALLRLEDPAAELTLLTEDPDQLNRLHLRFEQQLHGLPVWPAGLSVHLDPDANVDLVDGAYVPTPKGINPQPSIPAETAVRYAQASIPGGSMSATSEPALIIYGPLHALPRLAWKTTVSSGFTQSWDVLVDAHNGQVLNRLNRVCDANLATSATDMEGLSRNLNVWSATSGFYLLDTTKPSYNAAFDPLNDPRGVVAIYDAREVTQQNLESVFLVESANASQWIPDGVSAAYNFAQTFDYFFERHGRNSVDNQGGNIRAAVRIAEMDNAFWNGNQQMMFFGNVQPYPAALDVVGHELAHGVTEHSAGLIYELQSGALNEAFSDIFGEMVEARTEGTPDWKMGTKLNRIFRDMANPGSIQISWLSRPYPSRMSEFIELPNRDDSDYGGVHLNSSIINHCFYLLAEGLPNAIGMQSAERIFYRCLTVHLQKQSQFVDTRLGCIASAEALFGVASTEAAKTIEAFDTVEIFATPPTPEPPPLPPVAGEDSTILIGFDPSFFEIALGRRETAFNDPVDGVVLVESVQIARPSVSGDGTFAAFVDSAYDFGIVDTANPSNLQFLGLRGQVYSVAMSPDGNQFAFVLRDPVTGQPDNQITVVDLLQETQRTFTLLAPVLDGNPVDLVLYAESMVFTSDGHQLLYDAVSAIRFGNAPPVQRWSIFRLDLPTETTTVLVPPLEGYNTGNPNLGRAGNRYLTFDAVELATGISGIINLDLFSGELGIVGTVGSGFVVGYPCFSGDESAVVFAARDPSAFFTGFSLARQTLAPDRLSPVGQPTLWLHDAYLGTLYRRGDFTTSNAVPAVVLTSPTQNAQFTPGTAITLTATATDTDGITKVEFYEGANQLHEDTNSPYSFTWTNVDPGSYRITARAIDTHGGAGDSIAVDITVGQPAPIHLSAARPNHQTLSLSISAPAGLYMIEQSSNLTDWSPAFPLTIDASGTGNIDDDRPAPPGGHLFYRVRRN